MLPSSRALMVSFKRSLLCAECLPSPEFSWGQKFLHSLGTGQFVGHGEWDCSQVFIPGLGRDLSVVTWKRVGPPFQRERSFFDYKRKEHNSTEKVTCFAIQSQNF